MSTSTTEMEDWTIDLKSAIKARWTVSISKYSETVLPAAVMIALDSMIGTALVVGASECGGCQPSELRS